SAVSDDAARRVFVDGGEPVDVRRIERHAETPDELCERHLSDVAVAIARWLRDPHHCARGTVFEAQLHAVAMQMSADAEDASGDRGLALPEFLRMPRREIVRVTARRWHDVEIEWVDRDRSDPR